MDIPWVREVNKMFSNTNNKSENQESDVNEGQIHAPVINLPKGGGAIRGIGEKFGRQSGHRHGLRCPVPIATSPGRAGFGPQLALAYDSGAGNGPFGLGWRLSSPAITRRTDKGLPRYLDGQGRAPDSDILILSVGKTWCRS